MSYTLSLYRINKTKNDTYNTGTNLKSFTGVLLKEGCSLKNPVLTVNLGNTTLEDLRVYNYAYFNKFVYFVDDIKSLRNNIAEISMTRDPMGCAKTDIGSYSTYISRASNSYNVLSYDSEVDATFEYNHYSQPGHADIISFGAPIYVLTLSGMGASQQTSGLYWIVTKDLEQTMEELNDVQNLATDTLSGAQQWVLDMITNATFNPKDYIMSIRSYARDPGFTYGNHSVIFGLAIADLTNVYISNDPTDFIEGISTSVSVPTLHHQDFRKYNDAITQARLYLPCAGIKNIPMQLIGDTPSLSIVGNIDYTTGDMNYRVMDSGNTRLIAQVPTTFGSDIELSAGRNLGQIIVDNGVSLMESVKDLMVQPTNLIGNYSGQIYSKDWHTSPYLLIDQKICSDLPYHVKGRPVNETAQISTFGSGAYIECLNPHFTCNYLSIDEVEEINNYLRGGFYYNA